MVEGGSGVGDERVWGRTVCEGPKAAGVNCQEMMVVDRRTDGRGEGEAGDGLGTRMLNPSRM